MAVPLVDLVQQYHRCKDEIDKAVQDVMEKGQFILGENVEKLEQEVAAFCGVKHGIGVACGSDALHLALVACGIGPGDEVITTPFTFFATAGAIDRAGATPVFADIDPDTFNISPHQIDQKINDRTRAIIPVHLYGHPADMQPIMSTANRYGLRVIEDSAQALGATYRGQQVCSFGDLACISFFPTKNLGAYGDGGMVVTDDDELAERIRILRVHGSRRKYYHQMRGYNSRLDELQAAILRVKFKHLVEWTEARVQTARTYSRMLSDLPGLVTPCVRDDAYHVYHQYTVRSDRRDELRAHLKKSGIGTGVYYPLSLHLQKVFSSLGYAEGDYPESERATREVLSLPMFPELSEEQVVEVVEAIKSFVL